MDPRFSAADRVRRNHRAGLVLHRVRLRALLPPDRDLGRDQCPARHLARSAGGDPARRAVPQRDARAAGLPRPRADRFWPRRDRRARAQPFPAGFASATSLAASALVQSRSPT